MAANPIDNAITDNQWQTQSFDISSIADMHAGVYVRWSYQILNSRAFAYSGWNIDDVQLSGLAIVPNVVGMDQASAVLEITNVEKLTIGSITQQYSNSIPAGVVISQNPIMGTVIGGSSAIDLVVSVGPMEPITGIVWVTINDPGFRGQMNKYETTNAQFCDFLNAAKSANLITVFNNIVYAVTDTNHCQPYFKTYGATSDSQLTYSDGVFNVRIRDGHSMVNHPVIMVSYYGAIAYCNFYGYRLPSESEWQAVADYDGSYTYGCGTILSPSTANTYNDDSGYANPLNLTSYPYTTPVGYYPAYGYGMCDMAGNACEWTSTIYNSSGARTYRGGSWNSFGYQCTVGSRYCYSPQYMNNYLGFRICR